MILTGWLASSSLTFITFTIPLANLLTCGDDPKSLAQLTKGEIYSSGRKSANVNRPSHRMMPSSSMQGFSFINWLFFEIGFPDLKAVYSSQNASRCAKRTISSSASFISSSNSSIFAFLLSLLRMLSNTLLTLACTRSKRIQLENCSDQVSTLPVVVLFRCCFFL